MKASSSLAIVTAAIAITLGLTFGAVSHHGILDRLKVKLGPEVAPSALEKSLHIVEIGFWLLTQRGRSLIMRVAGSRILAGIEEPLFCNDS